MKKRFALLIIVVSMLLSYVLDASITCASTSTLPWLKASLSGIHSVMHWSIIVQINSVIALFAFAYYKLCEEW